MAKLLFYDKMNFFTFKSKVISRGAELHSISSFLDPNVIREMDKHKEYYIDLSSLPGVLKHNESLVFQLESQLLECFGSNVNFVSDIIHKEYLMYTLRYFFDIAEDIEIPIPIENKHIEKENETKHTIKRIVDLTDEELSYFFESFNSKLYGHAQFKREFKEIVESFRIFNKIGEHKILSLFLMGDSGVGKTEVARCIHKCMESKSKLAKINFGNYSSHDALNSLIGSPLGYVGSDGGELMKRVQGSDIGLILIDEFEKANVAVFNYFLDVLENGKIVNSQAEEYDIDGYIIVFTSNIPKAKFAEWISPELRSRFDYKGEFNLLTDEDKIKFVHFRYSEIIKKYESCMACKLPTRFHSQLSDKIDVSKFKNMRDLNKEIKDIFVKEINNIKIKS
jgi:AAA+ superfamily predicted ATPase